MRKWSGVLVCLALTAAGAAEKSRVGVYEREGGRWWFTPGHEATLSADGARLSYCDARSAWLVKLPGHGVVRQVPFREAPYARAPLLSRDGTVWAVTDATGSRSTTVVWSAVSGAQLARLVGAAGWLADDGSWLVLDSGQTRRVARLPGGETCCELSHDYHGEVRGDRRWAAFNWRYDMSTGSDLFSLQPAKLALQVEGGLCGWSRDWSWAVSNDGPFWSPSPRAQLWRCEADRWVKGAMVTGDGLALFDTTAGWVALGPPRDRTGPLGPGHVYELATGQKLLALPAGAVAFAAPGTGLLVKVGQSTQLLAVPTGQVLASASGELRLTGGERWLWRTAGPRTVELYDARSLKLCETLALPAKVAKWALQSVQLSADGRFVVADLG